MWADQRPDAGNAPEDDLLAPPTLRRSLSLPLLVLYGLGVTIGAGIYVLIGAAAGRAGVHAPVSFLVAAVVMVFSAGSFAEFASRLPVSAGEAAYVRAGFGSAGLSLAVGILVVLTGVVSSAAICVGSVGYIREFVDFPGPVVVTVVVFGLAAIAAWGITESVTFAAVFTLVEVGALVAVIVAGIADRPGWLLELPRVLPAPGDIGAWLGVSAAGLLAFFAFLGFEDMVNLAEEVKNPERTLPWAIGLTLCIATALYFLVAAVAVLTVPLDALAASTAPLSLVFEHITGASPAVITAVAIVATLNGVIIQIIMASRVVYGLARQGSLPRPFGRIHRVTRTPLLATATVAGAVLVLALAFPLEGLAEMTSRFVLVIFTLVNAALLKLKLGSEPMPPAGFRVGAWVPLCGCVSCLALLVVGFLG